MEAVSYLAPAIAPLAIKLIDKYIFNDQQAPVPQIIQIPAPPQCACCCGQRLMDDKYDSTVRTCSTCTSKSSSSYCNSKKHRLSMKSSVRSSSTSDAYEKEKSKALPSARCARRLSDVTGRSEKKSDKHNTDLNTLAVLASHLKKEICHCKSKTSLRGSDSNSIGKSASMYKSISSSRKSSKRSVDESKSSSLKSNRKVDGSRV